MLSRGEDVEAHALRQRGWTISAIARHLDRDRKLDRALNERVVDCGTGSRLRRQRALTPSWREARCGPGSPRRAIGLLADGRSEREM